MIIPDFAQLLWKKFSGCRMCTPGHMLQRNFFDLIWRIHRKRTKEIEKQKDRQLEACFLKIAQLQNLLQQK